MARTTGSGSDQTRGLNNISTLVRSYSGRTQATRAELWLLNERREAKIGNRLQGVRFVGLTASKLPDGFRPIPGRSLAALRFPEAVVSPEDR